MKNHDIISSLFWIGFGIIFCVGAVQNGIMLSPGVPGPGCLAFIVGCILIGHSTRCEVYAALLRRKFGQGFHTQSISQPETISSLTEENAISIHRVGKEAENMAQTAAELQNLVGQFKLAS